MKGIDYGDSEREWTSKTVERKKGSVTVTLRMIGQIKLFYDRKGSVTVTVRTIGQVKLLKERKVSVTVKLKISGQVKLL